MDWRDRIKADPAILVGKPCIKGTRMSVEYILELLAHGWSFDAILESWDHITEADIRACIAYGADLVTKEFERKPGIRARLRRAGLAPAKPRRRSARRKAPRRKR
jgi:uncharacterized protein (DUF433 family)